MYKHSPRRDAAFACGSADDGFSPPPPVAVTTTGLASAVRPAPAPAPAARPGELRIETVDAGTACILAVAGELDLAGSGKVRAAARLVTAPSVVVDVAGLTFLDAIGLSEILAARRELDLQGREVRIRGAQGIVRRVFEVTRLSHLLAG